MNAPNAYRVPRAAAPCDLFLDGNEGLGLSDEETRAALATCAPKLSRYPNDTRLTESLATRWGLSSNQVLVTAGGDDALDRICRVALREGGELILPVPGFEMVRRYAQLARGTVVEVEWDRAFPLETICGSVTTHTRVIVVTSPNNPTGSTVTSQELIQLRQRCPTPLLIVDLAYAEFCDEDLTETALKLPNTLTIRTFSKAWGLAGIRVGYAMGPPDWIQQIKAAGAPYAVSSLSLALAHWALAHRNAFMQNFVLTIREERTRLGQLLEQLGFTPRPSQGNFVFAEVPNPLWLRDALAGLGIAIRAFPNRPRLKNAIRITCPGEEGAFKRLCNALQTVCEPQALLFDIDGVLCDVRASYREAIQQTTEQFGVTVTEDDIQRIKTNGNANNDWVVSQRLCAQANRSVSLPEIRDVFEQLLQGTPSQPGLWTRERSLTEPEMLRALAKSRPIAAVTGRPRRDAERFLKRAGLRALFDVVVCMEDAPAKPSPAPVELALKQLGVQRAWMLGDTPDDMQAARAARVLPIGITAPGESTQAIRAALSAAGAARVFKTVQEFQEVVP
jgi:histidinol-phosphate aminotransferase